MSADGRWDLTRRLTLIILTWKIWWASNNASRWQMGFNSAFKGLNVLVRWYTNDSIRLINKNLSSLTAYRLNISMSWSAISKGKGKGKSAPLQARGTCSRKLRFAYYVIMTQNVGKVVSLTHRPFYPQKILLVLSSVGDRGITVVKVLCSKSEGRWSDPS